CLYYQHLKYECNLPMVLEVAFPDSGAGAAYCVVRIKKGHPSQPWQILHAVAGRDPGQAKIAIVVDEDINPRDPEMVNWALSYAMQPHRDIQIVKGRFLTLDPSAAYHTIYGSTEQSSAVLIDATRKFPYPPVGLPRREFMERALIMWQEEELPELKLREPWHGYTLGLWTDEHQENARLIYQGEYLKLGEELAQRAGVLDW
ncbi:MAG: UbiD family decarboxylase, partial [Dehalococcoidia bacterium]|nr:UbiD family decarboxylase [Dehalococcoidia bacterium]